MRGKNMRYQLLTETNPAKPAPVHPTLTAPAVQKPTPQHPTLQRMDEKTTLSSGSAGSVRSGGSAFDCWCCFPGPSNNTEVVVVSNSSGTYCCICPTDLCTSCCTCVGNTFQCFGNCCSNCCDSLGGCCGSICQILDCNNCNCACDCNCSGCDLGGCGSC